MRLGICTYGMIPIRSLPSEASELSSQLIFGETYEIRETVGKGMGFQGTWQI